MKELKLIAKTMHGMEGILSWELEKLGAKNIKTQRRAITFEGDKELLYRANYELRTALRVMIQTYTFTAADPTELYDQAKAIAWEDHLGLDETLAVDCTVSSDLFPHSKYASLKLKDAIVDRFREQFGRRPNVDPKEPNLQLNLFIQGDQCYISIDSSGDSLHIRGYRNSGHLSPMNEVLAAGMVVLSGWTKDKVLWDPMCGSGTIVIEAAMLASNTPAGLCRTDWAFMRWRDFDEKLWEQVKKNAHAQIDKTGISIKASDISGIHARMTRSSAELVGLEDLMTYEKTDFFDCHGDGETLIFNPPYGERLEHEDIVGFYVALSDHLKMEFEDSDVWMISSNDEALKAFSLRHAKRTTLYNGALECLFQKFEMYKGSRKGELVEKAVSYSDGMWPDPLTYPPLKRRVTISEDEEDPSRFDSRSKGRKESRDGKPRGDRWENRSEDRVGASKGKQIKSFASRDREDRKPYNKDDADKRGARKFGKEGSPSPVDSRRSVDPEAPKVYRDRTYKPKTEGDKGKFRPKQKWENDPDRVFKQRSEWKKADDKSGDKGKGKFNDKRNDQSKSGERRIFNEKTGDYSVEKSHDKGKFQDKGKGKYGDKSRSLKPKDIRERRADSAFKKAFTKGDGKRDYKGEKKDYKGDRDYKERADKPSYKKDGDKPAYKKDFKKDGGRPTYEKDGDRPVYKKDGEKPAYKKSGDKPPFRKDAEKPFKREFKKEDDSPKKDKPRGGGFKESFLKAAKKKGEE